MFAGEAVAPTAPVGRVPGCRVQLFSRTPGDPIRWRLLSSNNREIGRGVETYPDAETCRFAVQSLQRSLDGLQAIVRRADASSWAWQLQHSGRAVVVSPHSYDRQIRCGRALAQFVSEIRGAAITAEVMTSHARRWGGSVA